MNGHSFSTVFGGSRGHDEFVLRLDVRRPDDAHRRWARRLQDDAAHGRPLEALEALAAAAGKLTRPLAAGVLDAVAAHAAERAAGEYEPLTAAIAQACGLRRTEARALIVKRGVVHVTEPVEETPRRSVMTGCSAPGFIGPAFPAPRGSWQDPDRFELRRCELCEPTEAAQPDCDDSPDYPLLAASAAQQLTSRARELTAVALSGRLAAGPAEPTPEQVAELATVAFRQALTEVVAEECFLRGAEVTQRFVSHKDGVVRSYRTGVRDGHVDFDRLIGLPAWRAACATYIAGYLACEHAGLLEDFEHDRPFEDTVRAVESAERARLSARQRRR